MNKIGVLVILNRDTDIENELRKVKDMELDSCQLCVWEGEVFTDENAEKIKKCINQLGISVSSLWAGWSGPCEWNFTMGPSTIGLVPAAYRFERLKELLRASEFASEIGVNHVITHVGFLPENPHDPDYAGVLGTLRMLCRTLKERGQYFLFETGQETPVTLLRTIQAIESDNIGINFDTANLILYGKANSLDALDVFGKYVMDTHIKDGVYPTDGLKLGCEKPLGEGKANITEVVKKLHALGYTGPYTIEREISGEKQIQDIIAGRDLLRSILKTL